MFQGHRRGALRRAFGGSDPTVESLLEKITARQETIAALQLEIFDIKSSLEAFRSARDRRLGPYLDRIADLEGRIETARRQADFAATWKGRPDAPEFTTTPAEQFRKAWTSTGRSPRPAKAAAPAQPVDLQELRRLYRTLAKRFHPDLTTDPDEKIYRQEKMASINQAYMDHDQSALQELMELPVKAAGKIELTREQRVLEMYQEIDRLDDLILKLRQQLQDLNTSDDLHLALDFRLAQHEGRDLLKEYSAFYEEQIRALEEQLAGLQRE